MAKATFSEAELFVLSRWSESCQLELAVQEARKKYQAVLERVKEKVLHGCEGLDYAVLTKWPGDGWQLGFGSRQWPRTKYGSPCGYWIGNLQLEALASEEEPAPGASIWLKPAKKNGMNLAQACRKIKQKAESLKVSRSRRSPWSFGDGDSPLSYTLPERRKDLLAMLANGDSQKLVDCLASHIDRLSQFTPILDSVLMRGRR